MAISRDFKGIFIPKAIWLNKKLTLQERVFISEIDSLDHGDGCYAKNQHFSDLMLLSKNRCSEIIKALQDKGFVNITTEERRSVMTRIIRLSKGFDISKGGSESRQERSRSRQERSRSRQAIYKDEYIHRDIQERDARAFDFLQKNYPSLYESFMMQYKSQIKNFEKFVLDFNDKADGEDLEYTGIKILARISRFARNWIENDRKDQSKNEQLTSQQDRHKNQTLG